MLFRIRLVNRHDGSVIEKRQEAPSERLATKWAQSNLKRRDFKWLDTNEITFPKINFGKPHHV